MLLMISMISESGSPVRARCLQFRRQRRLAVSLVLVGVLLGGCGLPWSEPAAPATAVAPASVDPEGESFTCPGVPDGSVQAVTGEATFIPMVYWEKDDALRYLTCHASREHRFLFSSEFGRQVPGNPAGGMSDLYGDESNEPFTVEGVPDASGEVHIDKDSGIAIIICGDAFIDVSLNPRAALSGDLKGNLINLATSMTPWVCNGEVIPGLDIPLSPAKPRPETTTPTPQPTPDED